MGTSSGGTKIDEALPNNQTSLETEISPTCDLLLQYQRLTK